MIWGPVYTSLSVSCIATLICMIIGVPLGFELAQRKFVGKRFVLTLLNTLLSLPTVVVGLFVYVLICRRSPLGSMGLLFTTTAIVIGQAVLALPIMITLTHSAVVAVEKAARETAITLGARGFMLRKTMLMEARFGIMAAVVATFGRLIGEVGISMMLGGNIEGYTRTLTTAIALETSKGEFSYGLKLGFILLMIALLVNIVFRYLQGEGRR
jgi:tungstate transport system permease protein